MNKIRIVRKEGTVGRVHRRLHRSEARVQHCTRHAYWRHDRGQAHLIEGVLISMWELSMRDRCWWKRLGNCGRWAIILLLNCCNVLRRGSLLLFLLLLLNMNWLNRRGDVEGFRNGLIKIHGSGMDF